MKGASFILAIVVVAALGGALGWATRPPSAPETPRDPGSTSLVNDSIPEAIQLNERKGSLEREWASLAAAPDASGLAIEKRVAPKTLDEHLEFLHRLILRKAASSAWPRAIERFEAALAADPAMLAEFLETLSKPGEQRSFALTLFKEMSHDFLCRPEVVPFVRALAQDESAQTMDRVLAIGLAAGCWEEEDPAAWATLANLAQYDKDELVRQVALSRLQQGFEDDPRTKRLLAESWWREADPQARAGKLASMLSSMEPAERAETIARALRADRATEVKVAAAAELFQEFLTPDHPMTAELRRSTLDAALSQLTPHADIELRRVLVMSALAGGDEAQLRTVGEYLSKQEPDAKLKAWGESTVMKLLARNASRDEEFLRSLWESLKVLGDDGK